MAKRKRLTPAINAGSPVLETKSAVSRDPLGASRTGDPLGASRTRAPIADVAQDAAASAAFTEVARTLTDARDEGRLIQKLPLDAIVADHLVRDRIAVDADEMATLTDSLRARGQQTAIEVTQLDDGRYGLISGWRRLQALRALQTENPALDTVLALVRAPQDAADAYVAMVEENEIRVGLSFYERARIVVRATDRGVYRTDRLALGALFQSAPRAKRSKIGAFVRVVRALDDHLTYPTHLTERAGLALAQALEADATLAAKLAAALTPPAPSAEAEAGVISAAMTELTAGTGGRPAKPAAPPKVTRDRPSYHCNMHDSDRIVISGDLAADKAFRTALSLFLQRYKPL